VTTLDRVASLHRVFYVCASCHINTTQMDRVLDVSIQSDTELHVVTTPQIDEGDHERFTHIVLEGFTKKSGKFKKLNNSVVEGMINATPVKALCGKEWVPGKDPKKYPLCPTCKEIATSMGWSLPEG